MTETEESQGRRLPRGPHALPAELVARNQRERLIAAMAEACAERGYAEVAVADVVKLAKVSTVSFYRLFEGKRDCLLAAHRELLGRLLEEVDRVREEAKGEERTRASIRTLLALLAADPPSARLLTVEVLAAGPQGAARHDAAVEALAARLRPTDDRPGDRSLPNADWVLAAGILALIGKRVMAGEAASLPELEDELRAF